MKGGIKMQENYLSKKQQDEILPTGRLADKKEYYVLHNGIIISENPFNKNNKDASNNIYERNLFISEIRGR